MQSTTKLILPQDGIATDQVSSILMENAQLQDRADKLFDACRKFEEALDFARLAINLILWCQGGIIEISKPELDAFMQEIKVNNYRLDSRDNGGNLVFELKRGE
jgi:hypothetical protein